MAGLDSQFLQKTKSSVLWSVLLKKTNCSKQLDITQSIKVLEYLSLFIRDGIHQLIQGKLKINTSRNTIIFITITYIINCRYYAI